MTSDTRTDPVSTALDAASATVPAVESVPAAVTRDQVIAAIMTERGFERDAAGTFVDWMEGLVQRARVNDYATYFLSNDELRTVHSVMSAVMPDRATAEPGTAHALLETHLLDPSRGEVGLLHDQVEDDITFCTVDVRLSVIR